MSVDQSRSRYITGGKNIINPLWRAVIIYKGAFVYLGRARKESKERKCDDRYNVWIKMGKHFGLMNILRL